MIVKARLSDAELRIMDVLWLEGPKTAKALAEVMADLIGWSKTTTYTVIQKCIEKGAVARSGNSYLCTPVIGKDAVRASEAENLVNKLFDGEADLLVASLLSKKRLSQREIERLRKVIDEME